MPANYHASVSEDGTVTRRRGFYRVTRAWFCDDCETVHMGDLHAFSDEHRRHLHPMFYEYNPERSRR